MYDFINSVDVQDKFTPHAVFTYEFMAGLTKDGIGPLFLVLKDLGFDIEQPLLRYDHPEDRQIEFSQELEWQN